VVAHCEAKPHPEAGKHSCKKQPQSSLFLAGLLCAVPAVVGGFILLMADGLLPAQVSALVLYGLMVYPIVYLVCMFFAYLLRNRPAQMFAALSVPPIWFLFVYLAARAFR
jgi:hypothetical protein